MKYPAIHVCTALLVLLAACTSTEKPEPVKAPPVVLPPLSQELLAEGCPVGEMQGVGISNNYNGALDMAVSQIASQIQSSIRANNVSVVRSEMQGVDENITSTFESNVSTMTELKNRQDVHVNRTIPRGDTVGIVACMSRADAAKPYLSERQKIRDDFVSAAAVLQMTRHPQEKIRNHEKLVNAYSNYKSLSQVLGSLGVQEETASLDSDYVKLNDEFNAYRGRYGFYYGGLLESEMENAIFGDLSKNFRISKQDECEEGVMLHIDVAEPKCKIGGLGISCSQLVALTGSSCSGETYFTLGGTLKGIGRMSEEEALARLHSNYGKNDFVNEWVKELEKWQIK